MVQQSGGAIAVESEPNHGSDFKIFLPACEWESSSDKEPATSSSSLAGTETILLVEDQAGIRDVANDYLLQLGYKVLTAADGEAAMQIATCGNQHIDLLITDVVMPKMGGRELAGRLAETHPTARVLFISGYPDGPMPGQEDSIVEGEILRKPFSLKALASKARWLLDAGGETQQ